MNVGEVEKAITEIEAARADHERAHGLEDELYIRVLKAIAAGTRTPRALAKAALAAQNIKFFRHTA
jgi:hypothetical protein